MNHHERAGNGAMDRRLWGSAVVNGVITLAELAAGALAGSLALLSDALHNLGDTGAVVLALAARRFARRPPTLRHTYGFKRVEVLAALVNGVVLIATSALIAREAVARFLHPQPVRQGLMLTVALVALLGNALSVWLLHRHERDDLNVRSAFLHMVQDALASVAVVVAALLAQTPVGPYVDPAAAVLIALVVLRSAWALVWETVSTLLEGAPADVELAPMAAEVAQRFAGTSLHHVHLWQNGPGERLLTAHVTLERVLDGAAIEQLLAAIKAFLHERYGIAHATLEPEVAGCGERGLLGSLHGRGPGNRGRSGSVFDGECPPLNGEAGGSA